MDLPALPRRPALILILATFALAALSTWARLGRTSEVMVEGEVLFLGVDTSYHMRRAFVGADTFPRVETFDALMNWPDGGCAHWPPGFDGIGSLALLLSGTAGEQRGASIVLGALPLLWSLLGVAAAFAVVVALRRSWSVAVAAAVLICVLPECVAIGRFGRFDHHVAECLFMGLIGLWGLWAVELGRPGPPTPGRRVAFEIAGTAILVGALSVFTGSVVYAGIGTVMVMLATLTDRGRPDSRFGAGWGLGAPAYLVTAVLVALMYRPAWQCHGHAFSYIHPSFLQPLFLGFAAGGCAAASTASSLVRPARPRWWTGPLRVGACVAVLLPAVAVVLVVAPGVVGEIHAAMSTWFGRNDAWTGSVQEQQPLFGAPSGPGGWATLYGMYGIFGPAAAVTIPIALLVIGRDDLRRGLAFAIWTAGVCLLSLAVMRFQRVFVFNVALCSAVAIGAAFALLRRRVGLRIPAGATILLILLAVAADPALRSMLVVRAERSLHPAEEAAVFLRGAGAADRIPQGVMAPWGEGHRILWTSGLPVVANGFGKFLDADSFNAQQRAWAAPEADVIAWMQQRQLRWLVSGPLAYFVSPRTADGRGPFYRDAEGIGKVDLDYLEAFPAAATILGGSGLPLAGIPHLQHLCPRFASTLTVEGLGGPIPEAWVFERVPGCTLRLSGPPAALVVAETTLTAPPGVLSYQVWTRLDADGAGILVVPLPNAMQTPHLQTGPWYRVRAGDGAWQQFVIGEGDVVAGRERVLDLGETPIDLPRPPLGIVGHDRAQ